MTTNPFLHLPIQKSELIAENGVLKVPFNCPVSQGRSIDFISEHSSSPYRALCFHVTADNISKNPYETWLPAKLTSENDELYGIQRSMDCIRLSGVKVNNEKGLTVEEILVSATYRLSREGSKPNIIMMPAKQYAEYKQEKGELFNPLQPGFPFPLEILVHPGLPFNRAYILTLKTWFLHETHGYYCENPGFNAVINFTNLNN